MPLQDNTQSVYSRKNVVNIFMNGHQCNVFKPLSHEVVHQDNLRQQYDDKLLHELQQLRTQNEQEIVLLREEMAAQYERKVRVYFSMKLKSFLNIFIHPLNVANI